MIKAHLSEEKKMLKLLGFGSLLMIGAALFFEHVMGLHPCKMCIWQRIPHYITIGLAAISLIPQVRKYSRPVLGLMSLSLLVGASIAFWHSGVELKLLEGPSSCSAAMSLTGDPSALLDQILSTPAIRCDEVPWSFLGLSMANWNFLITFAMTVVGFTSIIMAKAKTE